MSKYLVTSESVTEGHPDKVCDQISDGVLDAVLHDDPAGRVACETVATTSVVFVTGEIKTTATIDMPKIVRGTLKRISYDAWEKEVVKACKYTNR
jgi:S-adenosylmethionine synthetase